MQRTSAYLHIPPGTDLPAMQDASPFTAILVADDEVAQMWQWEASRWLVESGCRYLLAWGKDCAAWEEAVQEANQETFDYEDIPEERLVLTTAHEDEDLEEVFWFAKHRAAHPALSLNRTLIVHVAQQPRQEEIEAAYADA